MATNTWDNPPDKEKRHESRKESGYSFSQETSRQNQCIAFNPEDYTRLKEDESLQTSPDSGPFAMRFYGKEKTNSIVNDKFSIEQADYRQNSEDNHYLTTIQKREPTDDNSENKRMKENQPAVRLWTMNKDSNIHETEVKTLCQKTADDEKQQCHSKAQGGCFLNREIQQPHSPDLESSIVYTQQRVLSRVNVDNANHMECQARVGMEREYLLVPFSPGYCFNQLKEENIRLHQRIKTLEQENLCQSPQDTHKKDIQKINPITFKGSDVHGQQDSTCPLIMRVLERTFSKQAVKIAKDFLDFENDQNPISMSKLLELLYDIDDGKLPLGMVIERPLQEHKADFSLEEERTDLSNLCLYLTLKLKNADSGGQ